MEYQRLNPKLIEFDEDNPRGESEEQIVNDPEFIKLVSSIKDYGVLEPLIVKHKENKKDKFKLIDGERRLRAAIIAKKDDVPALIAASDTDGRILAYQVHKLRKDWSKIAETKSIRKIITDLTEDHPNISDAEIKREVINITRMTSHAADDIIILTKYDEEIINKVILNKYKMSYLVQIEKSFVRPVKREFPKIITQFKEQKIRNILANKAFNGKLGDTRYLMDTFAAVFQDRTYKGQVEKIIIRFLENDAKDIVKTYEEYKSLVNSSAKPISIKPKAKSNDVAQRKNENLQLSKASTLQGYFQYRTIKITSKQQTQISGIRPKFENIAGIFTQEEMEYISEAIYCLEIGCFKAATLMIWAASISKILSYVGKNINDFNQCSSPMSTNPKSVYKHLSKTFIKNASDITEIRHNGNDLHLLSYLYFKTIISDTQFKKLKSNYDTRNDCAHPTDITLTPNEILAMFDNLYNYIFSNKKII